DLAVDRQRPGARLESARGRRRVALSGAELVVIVVRRHVVERRLLLFGGERAALGDAQTGRGTIFGRCSQGIRGRGPRRAERTGGAEREKAAAPHVQRLGRDFGSGAVPGWAGHGGAPSVTREYGRTPGSVSPPGKRGSGGRPASAGRPTLPRSASCRRYLI